VDEAPAGEGREDADRLVTSLEEAGFLVRHEPLFAFLPPRDPRPLERGLRGWLEGAFDVLLLTSPRAARVAGELLERLAPEPGAGAPGQGRAGKDPREIWAVGPTTARVAAAWGLAPHRVPETFLAEALLEEAREWRSLAGLRVLFPRAEEGRDVLSRGLALEGAHVTLVVAYRSGPVADAARSAAQAVVQEAVDVVVLTAGSQVRALHEAWPSAEGPLGDGWPAGVRVVAIGPAAASVARHLGVPVTRVADPHTFRGVVEAVRELAEARGRVVDEAADT
jgi:uroporphyrinogen-III synthase